jgi:hypothetical protein
MKQTGINPKLLIPALLCGIMGIVFEFAPYPEEAGFFSLKVIAGLLTAVDLEFFNSSLFHINEMHYSYNLLNCIFYLLLVIGAIIYLVSKKREMRLLRFCLAIMLICNLSFLVSGTIFKLIQLNTAVEFKSPFWLWLLYRAINLGWAFYAWSIFSKLSADRALQTVTYAPEAGGVATVSFVEANRWQRLFHFVLDSYLAVLLFSQLPRWGLSFQFWEETVAGIPQELALSIALLLFRLVYYLAFETVLGTTPAKLLTETRVTGNEGEKKGFGTILARTFSRMVPFEPLSFFGRGWHDTWSNTYVLKEVRTGYKPTFFLLVILVVFLLVKMPQWGIEAYKSYQYEKANQKTQALLVAAYENEFRHLSTGHVFQVQYETGLRTQYEYLKVEEIQPQSIKVCRFSLPNNMHTETGGAILAGYLKAKGSPQNTFEVDRATILLAAQKEFGPVNNGTPPKAYLFKDGSDVTIKRLLRIDRPFITAEGNTYLSGSEGKQGTIGLSFKNLGKGGSMTVIQNTTGDSHWANRLPQTVRPSTESNDFSFDINSNDYKVGSPYRFIVSFEYDEGQVCKYVVEGTGTQYGVMTFYE